MGRAFETLRRRDTAHALAGESVNPSAPRPSTATPPEFDFGAPEVPFIEVGGSEVVAHLVSEFRPRLAERAQDERPAPAPGGAVEFVPRSARPNTAPVLSAGLVLLTQPQGEEANQFRRVRDALLPELARASIRCLLLAPTDDYDATTATLNLALAFAESSERSVLVIDAEGRRAAVATHLELALAPGWSELLAGLPLAQALQESGFGRLHVVAAGNRLVEGSAVLHGERVREILEACRRRYEITLIQSPAASASAEFGVLARVCDAVCLVQPAGFAEPASDAIGLRELQQQGLRILGSIVTSSG
jgi:Mrp family chromosome partitioning ATPase